MRAHNVIIVTAGRIRATSDRDLSALLKTLRELKKTPVLALGPDGDDLLRLSEEIENCEIIFDPNFAGDFFSSVKAGLFATHGAALVVALGESMLDFHEWARLESLLANAGEEHVLRLAQRDGESPRFPLLITARGVSELRELPSETDWLKSSRVIVRDVALNTFDPSTSP